MKRVLIIFYSHPIEASLTALFRGLEVCNPDEVIIISTRRRGDEVRKLLGILKNIKFRIFTSIPDIETSFNEIPQVIDHIKNIFKSLTYDEICFVSSAGSRIEVSALSMVLDRSKTTVLYVSFPWGPWTGSFYPYTPKPIQIVHEIHGSGVLPVVGFKISSINHGLIKNLTLPSFRKDVLLTQFILNTQLAETPCYATRDSIDCMCPTLYIDIVYKGMSRIHIRINNYCSWDNVIRSLDELAKGVVEFKSTVHDEIYKILELMLKISGIYVPVIDECSFGCRDLKDVILIDSLDKINRNIIADTNIIYSGLHNQIYERENKIRRYLELPLCLYLELYEHQAQFKSPYTRIRSLIAQLLADEINFWKLPTNNYIAHKPCEVGIALELARSRECIAITADRHAYERLFRFMNLESILVKPQILSKVKFLTNEKSRRASYAYYALAQFIALARRLSNELNKYTLRIEAKFEF